MSRTKIFALISFVLAAAVATTLSATIGLTALAWAGFASWSRYGSCWLPWWLEGLGGAPRAPDQLFAPGPPIAVKGGPLP